MINSFTIDENKQCYLNGQEIKNVLNIDIQNINATEFTEVVLTILVDSVNVKYKKIDVENK